jgi:3-hexulose-6-phosphate synthase/6-phospho-3-hexuloisomerase
MVGKPTIQLALDFLDLERAIKVAAEAAEYVDWIEAGTPLIKSEGLDAVRRLRELYPDKKIVADMKVMDAGRVEVEAAAKAGADIVDVCAQASEATIAECVEAAQNFGCKITVDLIGADDPVEKAVLAQKLGADFVAVHTAIDEQMQTKTPFDRVRQVCDVLDIPVAAAGGLNTQTVAEAVGVGAQILIVGGAITKAADAGEASRAIRQAADSGRALESKLYVRSEDIRNILSGVSSSNVSDAMHRGGDLTGLSPVTEGQRACGPAVTVRTYPGDWAKPVEAIDHAKEGDVIVITSGGVGPAVWGELATESAIQKKIAAVVIDGASRDTDEIRK